MLVFVAILVVALAYVWRKKAIGWEVELATTRLEEASAWAKLAQQGMLDKATNWGRKFSLFTYPFVTRAAAWNSCRSPSEVRHRAVRRRVPAFSPRQSDLLMVVGTITENRVRRSSACSIRWRSRSG